MREEERERKMIRQGEEGYRKGKEKGQRNGDEKETKTENIKKRKEDKNM